MYGSRREAQLHLNEQVETSHLSRSAGSLELANNPPHLTSILFLIPPPPSSPPTGCHTVLLPARPPGHPAEGVGLRRLLYLHINATRSRTNITAAQLRYAHLRHAFIVKSM